MAITRAQQVRQMLIKGGVVNPDGRRGFFEGAEKESREKGTNISPGTKGKTDPRSGPERRDDNPYRPGPLPPASITPVDKPADKPNIIDRIKKANKDFQTRANKAYIRRNFDYIAGGRKPLPVLMAMAKSLGDYRFDESDYLGLEDESPGRFMAQFGPSIVGTDDEERIREMSKILGQDVVTREDIKPFLPPEPKQEGDGPQPLDPCKGPNPPAYCFVGIRSVEPEVAEYVNPLSKLTPRIAGTQFAADGGRIGFFKGAVAGGGNISPGTDVRGNVRDDNPFTGGGGDGPKGPPSVINPPPKTNPIVEKLKKRNPPSDSIFKRFVDHDRFTDFMKILQTPNYHQMGGLDFMARFPNINPDVAKGLGTAYQQITEMAKANPDPLDDYTDIMENAQKKAIEEARLNAVGIDDFFDPTSDTYKQYTDTSFGVKDVAVPLADGGIASLDREAFLLGGIAKGLKKAVKGVKKLVKSPIGKAAIGAALFGGFGGGLKSFLLGTNAGPNFSKTGMLQKLFLKNPSLGFSLSNINPTTGILGVSTLAGLMTPKEGDNNEELAKYLAQNQLNPNAPLNTRIAGSQFDFYGGQLAADGGRIGYQEGSKEPVAKKTMPLLDMDGKEKDYRETGGFVDMGRMERADDVPARLSKNEFVFTADAVRNAGEGDIDKGAEVMYNMMKNLEAGGEVSEESQGLEGARRMFQTSQRLGEVI